MFHVGDKRLCVFFNKAKDMRKRTVALRPVREDGGKAEHDDLMDVLFIHLGDGYVESGLDFGAELLTSERFSLRLCTQLACRLTFMTAMRIVSLLSR